MSKKEVELVEPATVKSESSELVTVEGVTLDIWKDSDSTFVPALKKDMPLADRREAVRHVTQQVTHMKDRLHAVMGEMLYEISVNKYWRDWDYRSFEEYLESECEVSRRTAFYYISVYRTFVIELGIPADEMRELEWSKAKEIVNLVDKDNWKEVIDLVATMSVSEVKDYVSTTRTPDTSKPAKITDEDDPVSKRMSFRLADSQYENIERALEIAKSMSGSDKSGNQLDLICTTFISEAPGVGVESSIITLDQCIKSLERTFAVKLELKDVDADRYASVSEA